MRCTYKTLTYVLAAILLSILGAVTVISVTLYNNKKMFLVHLFFNKSFQRALRVATCNSVLRIGGGGLGDFHPDPDVAPPPSTPSSAVTTTTTTTTTDASDDIFFSLSAAKFAAQLVAILEKAASQKVPPVPRPDTVLLRLLGGVEVPPPVRTLGWVLRVAAGDGRDRDQIWVAFRGTQTKAEWRHNFNMSQVALARDDDDDDDAHAHAILVHRGFWSMYTEIRAELLTTLSELLETPTTLYVTGHSLGAAIAMLCLVDLLVLSPPALAHKFTDVRCYLFGAPRVGNRAFVNLLRRLCADRVHLKEFFILANDDDVVPCLPLAVQPNLDTPDIPCLYAQYPIIRRFFSNVGNWTDNHTIPVYLSHLDKLGKQV